MNKKLRLAIVGASLLTAFGITSNVKLAIASSYNYKVATVTAKPMAHLYDKNGQLIADRVLIANTDWRVGEIKKINSEDYLQVSTNEWLRLNDSRTNFDMATGHIYHDFIGTVKGTNTSVYNDETKQYSNQSSRFPKNSAWKVSYIIKNSQGQYFYRVSNHEFITKNGMWLNDIPQDTDVSYQADFGLNAGGSSSNNVNPVSHSDSNITPTQPAKTNDEKPNTTPTQPNNNQPGKVTPTFNEDTDSIARAIVNSVNNERASQGIPALKQHSGLMAAAAVRAQEQVKSYGHIRPNGQNWSSILTTQYYPETETDSAENAINITAEVTDPNRLAEITMMGFKSSAGHYRAIMNPIYKDIGVGVYLDKPNNRYYVIQIFANPYVDWRNQK
ncbi:CAP domain-containing protein [Bombilactobacillus bombi]|uniref:CAP domain-containing protein n=1 Tax=Bombilactobacillus bombi TaxID=1303590 RepID=UPI0035EC6956